jgi:hypothetical protein
MGNEIQKSIGDDVLRSYYMDRSSEGRLIKRWNLIVPLTKIEKSWEQTL